MFELYEIWRTSKAKDEEFLRRVRVYSLPDAQISKPLDRLQHAKFWKGQHDELKAFIKENGADLLGEQDLKQFRLMQNLYGHVSDILATMADIVRPRTFEELKAYGFGDPLPEKPSASG
jgi:internalin A